jgi:regulation of enolase protein 1 (concanavalin A-like superfamily)
VRDIDWGEMQWLNEPATAAIDGMALVVETGPDTDFWHQTGYGFIHADGHFLGLLLNGDAAIEVTFRADLSERFDQAGLMLYAAPDVWLKTGVERSDGQLFASVVATAGHSDWSIAPLPPEAEGQALTFRASRAGDGVTIRYRVGDAATWQMLRLAYMPPDAEMRAGPMCCSPTRAGLSVRFESVRVGPPDAKLHED